MGTISKRLEHANEVKQLKREREIRIAALTEAGYSVSEIAKTLDVSEGYVRNVIRELENGEIKGNRGVSKL